MPPASRPRPRQPNEFRELGLEMLDEVGDE
jgi:hypothetical protein